MDALIRSLFADAGYEPSDDDVAWFERLRDAVVAGSRRMNLTRLTEPRDFHLKHVLDSVLPFLVVPMLRDAPERLMVADLGAGAGFPGLVLARLRPQWDVALIERTEKKAGFLEDTIDALGLERVYTVPLDAREAARRVPALHRGCHVVTARAVGRIAPVTAAAAPLLARGGVLVHYKGGAPAADELAEGRAAAKRHGFEQLEPFGYVLPPDAQRSVVLTLNPATRRKRGSARRRSGATRESRGDTAR